MKHKLICSIHIFYFFALYFSILCFNLQSQSKDDIVAKAGSIVITKEEFIKRYEFSPHAQTETAYDSSTTIKDFLFTLIAEKLLAQNAIKENLDKIDEFESLIHYIQNIYLRDALYKKEIKDKVVLADSDIAVGESRILKTLKVKFIFSEDQNEIEQIFSSLQNGASFDSILAKRPENSEQPNPAEVTFGKMDPKVEDEIFKLNPNQFTPPIKLKEGWYICKVYDAIKKNALTSADISNVKKIVASRTEDKIYEDFYKKFFKDIQVNVDRKLFEKLVEEISNYIKNNQPYFKERKNNKLRLAEKEFIEISKTFANKELNESFVKFEVNPLSLKNFLKNISFAGIEFDSSEIFHIKSRLNNFMSNFIRNELYAREALKRGYDKLPEIADELKMWKEYYLSREMMKNIFKKQNVSDEEAEEFYSKMNKVIQEPDSVNILEILTDNLETVELILNEINDGVDFTKLAEKYSMRDSLRLKNGKFGLRPINELGELGKIASQMKIGEVFGPIKTDEGFSIIKLIDKKKGEQKRIESFEDAKEDIKNILQTKKMYSELDKITAQSALEYGIEINENLLKSIKVTNINMVVFRRFGFGGQLIAVPYAPLYSTWFKVYQQSKKELSF